MVSSGRQTALMEDGQDSTVDEHEMQVQELMVWLQWVNWLGPPREGAPHPNATVVEDVQTHPSDNTPLISHHDTRARSTLLRPPPAEASSHRPKQRTVSFNKRSYCEEETCSLSSSCK